MRQKRKSAFNILLFLAIVVVIAGLSVFAELTLRKKGYAPGFFHVAHTSAEDLDSIVQVPIFIAQDGITRYNAYQRQNHGIINSEGFRSPEFIKRSERDTSKLCIALIGDSFTFGMTAEPIQNCFADRLRSTIGSYVDNLGVEGADLPEYSDVAHWYIPRYEPDLVYIILSDSHHDLVNFIREKNADYPFQYSTNIGGVFPAYDECGKFRFRNALESKEYYLEKYTLFNKQDILSCLLSKSVLGTQFWKLFFWKDPEDACGSEAKSGWYFNKIDSLCGSYGAEWRIVVIPNRDDRSGKKKFHKKNKDHFLHYNFLFINLEKNDYVSGADSHTNNSGHEKIMNLLYNNILSFKSQHSGAAAKKIKSLEPANLATSKKLSNLPS